MKVTGWAVVCTILRPDNTWFTKTITELPDSVSGPMDDYLTERWLSYLLAQRFSTGTNQDKRTT